MTTPNRPGVQNERTALAWQRTAVSLLVVTGGLARLEYDRFGSAGLACLVALPLTLGIFLESSRRYRRRDAAGGETARGGITTLALASAILVLCIAGFAIVAHQ